MIKGYQIRAARAILGWSREDLSKASGVYVQTILNFENETSDPRQETIYKMISTLEAQNIEFIESDGVRKRQEYMKRLKGSDGFKEFMEMVYKEAKTNAGNFCIYNASPSQWKNLLKDDKWHKMHIERMAKIFETGKLDFKITCPYGDTDFIGSKYAEYRWITEDKWSERSFYVFGQYIAILIFQNTEVEIILFKEQALANTFLELFNIAWETIAVIPNG